MNNANSDNSSVNTTSISNKINPEHLYGLDANSSCLNNACQPGKADTGYYIPSIDEIVKYNPGATSIMPPVNTNVTNKSNDSPQLMQAEAAYEQGASTSEEPPENINRYSGNLQDIPFIEGLKKIDTSTPALPSTPATTSVGGATMAAPIGESLGMSVTDYAYPYPVTAENLRYHNGFMRTQIGRRVTVDFLVGSNTIVQKTGYLLGVAQDYILLNELDTNDITTCDYYNIKFIKYYY